MTTKTKPPKDAIALLKEDHATVRELLDELEKAAMNDGSEAETLLETIEAELKVHTTIEEEIFYPPSARRRAGRTTPSSTTRRWRSTASSTWSCPRWTRARLARPSSRRRRRS